VELLIVIIVIGILASIVIVSYNGIQKKAQDTSLQNDLTHIGDMFDIYRTNTGIIDEYPSTIAHLQGLGAKVSRPIYDVSINANFIACVSADRKSFAVVGKNKTGTISMVTDAGVAAFSQSASSFTYATTCSSLGLTLIDAGWYSGAWSSWVASS
jgi:type II secretory pathway pseudopilin PulG